MGEPFDLERAAADPADVFGSPERLVAYAGLGRRQKLELLRRWAYDAAALSVAEEEGMSGRSEDLAYRVRRCLRALEVGDSPTKKTPGLTKYGSVPAPPSSA